ncbi:MAG: hypothetical protein E6I61_11605 [Chloroflexi bacterium]|nr:MAG: hypothetical protein E6I61_11605 [Chloroflexota bacterium]
MSARRPVRKGAPLRKPVAGTPGWVMPAAVVAGIAVVVAAFWVIRWYTTPLPPKAPSQSETQVVLATITNLRASERFRTAQRALLSQYPMLLLMVLYTMTSLWILAQPITRES